MTSLLSTILIPKLANLNYLHVNSKCFLYFRFPGRAKYQTKEEVLESIYIDSTASCFGDINAQRENDTQLATPENKSEKEDTLSRNESRHSRSVSGSWPNLNEESKQTNLSEDSIGHSRNPSEIDSLDSNYVRKHYNFEAHRKNYKDSSPETERSVVSPNHSKELYVTTDDHESDNEDRDRSVNNTPKSFTNDSLSITHSDKDRGELVTSENINNINSCEDTLIVNKPEECEDEQDNISISKGSENKPEDDAQSVVSENDGTISSPPDSITSYISISIASSDKSHKLEYLANSLAEKIDEYCDSQFKENISVTSRTVHSENNPESDPIYTQVNKKKTFADIKRDSFSSKSVNLFNEVQKKQSSEVFISNTYIESDTYSTKSHCTSSKNITTEPFVTTLIENQYYSLPDINISKCLRKSERIDAQLREEDPEDIPCENTYEIAQTHFREILSSKTNGTYGQLNKSNVNQNNNTIKTNNAIYLPEYSEPHLIQNFAKLEDDLKSILTIESSNAEDKDAIFYSSDTHQNEREINEIEGTIRNNKVITKSESLKINSVYRPEIHITKSLSNDNISKSVAEKKCRVGIKKHYSLRQRDPIDDDNNRVPSPGTVEKTIYKPTESTLIKSSQIDEIKANSLLSRVQSFKTSAESSIAIVPLSGHQTIVIDPPLSQKPNENIRLNVVPQQKEVPKIYKENSTQVEHSKVENNSEKNKEIRKPLKEISSIDTSSFYTPKDPFITIKLNKVVKTTIPKLKKETCEKISYVQHRFEKPPPKLIIKDSNNTPCHDGQVYTFKKVNTTMTRPQILQVIDSRNKQIMSNKFEKNKNLTNNPIEISKSEENTIKTDDNKIKVETNLDAIKDEIKNENSVKEKLVNAIKTDIEYQEKINSVKNYWSRLIDQSPDAKEQKPESNLRSDDLNNNNENDTSENVKENKEETNNDGEKCSPEVSVCSIIKSLESVKIVDSIRKISQTKLHLWKDETEKVKSDSEIEEAPLEKIVKDSETQIYDKPKPKKPDPDLCRDTPEIEIVELTSEDNQNLKTQATLIKAKGYDKNCDEFDHVRYKVMKSELFKNSMIANYRKEAQFDGLLQYLQDYSFQELLVNNNIVIIEPVRTKVEPAPRKNTDTCKIPPTLLKKSENSCSQVDKSKNAIRRHFFYHPIRVNKEIIEEELPNPDTVKKVRNLFEDTLKMKSPMSQDPPLIEETIGLTRRATSYRNLSEETKGSRIGGRKKVIRQLTIDTNFGNKKWDNASMSSGVSSGDLSSNNEYENEALSPYSHKNLKDNAYSSSDEYLCDSMSQDFCCESQYVSPDILRKIRECGTSVTYYGGKVLNSKTGSTVSPMTKAIMEEIKSLQKNCSRDCYSCQTKCRGNKCSCLVADKHKQMISEKPKVTGTAESTNQIQDESKRPEGFPGFKFKLVKSNSCSSRLELTGTDDSKNPRMKFKKHITEDPPLVYDRDDENSVKNKICRLESYSKGIVKTPFDNKKHDDKKDGKNMNEIKRNDYDVKKSEIGILSNIVVPTNNQEPKDQETAEDHKTSTQTEKQAADAHSFEKKFYYVNDTMDQSKATTGKFGEMVFEEFEVLESCFDSLNSNKSLK